MIWNYLRRMAYGMDKREVRVIKMVYGIDKKGVKVRLLFEYLLGVNSNDWGHLSVLYVLVLAMMIRICLTITQCIHERLHNTQ